MRTLTRVLTAAAVVAAAVLAGSPARADDFGFGFGADMATLSPMEASSLMGDALGIGSGTGLISTFDTGQHFAESYDVVSDLATDSALAVSQADVAKQAQEAADAKRRAAVSAAQNQVGPDGCPVEAAPGTLRDGSDSVGVYQLCANSVAKAPSAAAAGAIKFAFRSLGAAYACGGVGRLDADRFDCSSLVARAYHDGGGLPSAGKGWSPSTREMVPWTAPASPRGSPWSTPPRPCPETWCSTTRAAAHTGT